MRFPILIAGPTASGKSDLALAIAQRCGGVVINADSMQVYRELAVLTARPGPTDLARAPHLLYGHVGGDADYSVAHWLADAAAALAEAASTGRRPIVVGGTGLYFKALTEGLAPVPAIPPDLRAHWRREAARRGAQALHAELQRLDPEMAGRLAPGDTQRLTRALEVIAATGRSLADWQAAPHSAPLVPLTGAVPLVVDRPREDLLARADRRFDAMLASGAVEEVAGLLAVGLDPERPVLRALGVRPIAGLLAGRLRREAAAEAGKIETRQYIKRQITWLQRHMIAWSRVQMDQSFVLSAELVQFIDGDPALRH